MVWVKSDSNEGGRNPKFIPKANGVTIFHKETGGFSNYLHLKYKGVLVKKNQEVKKGEIIGFVGETGWTPAPHLHFVVFKIIGNNFEVDYKSQRFELEGEKTGWHH